MVAAAALARCVMCMRCAAPSPRLPRPRRRLLLSLSWTLTTRRTTKRTMRPTMTRMLLVSWQTPWLACAWACLRARCVGWRPPQASTWCLTRTASPRRRPAASCARHHATPTLMMRAGPSRQHPRAPCGAERTHVQLWSGTRSSAGRFGCGILVSMRACGSFVVVMATCRCGCEGCTSGCVCKVLCREHCVAAACCQLQLQEMVYNC